LKFQLEINMDNAAFQDNPLAELADCLKEIGADIAEHSDAQHIEGKIKDHNGNTVGSWSVE